LKVTLRKFKLKDVNSLAENTNEKLIAKNLIGIILPYTKKDSLSWIKEVKKEYLKSKPNKLYFGIIVNGIAVGEVGLYDIDHENKHAELVYWIGKNYRGKGIVKKAVKQMLDYGFKKLKLVRIFATIFVYNKQSIDLLKSLKFKYEGKQRKVTFKDGKYLDEYTYALIK